MIDWNLSNYDLGRLTMAIDLSGTFAPLRDRRRAAPLPFFQFKRTHREKLVMWFGELLGTSVTKHDRQRLQVAKTGIDVIRLAHYTHPHLSQQRQEQIHDMLIECHKFVERAIQGFHSNNGWQQLEPKIARWARRLSA